MSHADLTNRERTCDAQLSARQQQNVNLGQHEDAYGIYYSYTRAFRALQIQALYEESSKT